MVEHYRASRGDGTDKEIKAELLRNVDASPSMRNKRDLIEQFIDEVNNDGRVEEQWRRFVLNRREHELTHIIEEEHLREDNTRAFIEDAFRRGNISFSGLEFASVLPRLSRFSKQGSKNSAEKKRRVADELQEFFQRFYALTQSEQSFMRVDAAGLTAAADALARQRAQAGEVTVGAAEKVLSDLLSSADTNAPEAQVAGMAIDLVNRLGQVEAPTASSGESDVDAYVEALAATLESSGL